MEPQIFISQSALLHNLSLVTQGCVGTKIVAVIKANAYGHSMLDVARILSKRIAFLGVSTLEEAMFLKNNGIEDKILIQQGFSTYQELEEIAYNNFHFTIFHNHQIELIKKLSNAFKATNTFNLHPWLKVNTGMCRLGIEPEVLPSHLQFFKKLGCSIRIMSHMSCQDTPEHPLNQIQIERFYHIAQSYSGHEYSLFNSSAPFCARDNFFDYVRIGIALYGISPLQNKTSAELGLQPVMRFYGQIISIDERKCGEYIGYCATHQLSPEQTHSMHRLGGDGAEKRKIATVAVGYSHGYPAINCGYVLLGYNKAKCQIVGKVSMNMLTIDVTHILDAQIGAQVCLWGAEELLVEHVERFSGQSRWVTVTKANAPIVITE
ncbi:Alanine racemase [Rickettsiales endosymbiont of Paramecium tredecaurelia]|uniref:alanine racemase n=1 Tax=Candidatus Sarmatiella mevalonica TaxID=2770581 RepID=UPI001923D009|nr:alanine racemase [Candidatus Sarmatiella mevalonica]MBL3285039.1 Alanine racemase [Candidatus Sarmatiella mevalonica]